MRYFIQNLQNNFDFWLRKQIKFSRGNYNPPNEPKNNLFKNNAASEKEKYYLEKYHLQRLKSNSKKRLYLENLSIIELLESYLNLENADSHIEILDIGSKNWFYAEGEHSFFKFNTFQKTINLTGIEIDAYRLYTDLYSRYDYASYYIQNLKNTKYITGDVLKHYGKYDYITWFFPFVTEKPLLSWGLPIKYFKPEAMLEHAYSLLKPNGTMIIINQGKNEYIKQENLLIKLNLPYSKKGLFNSIFLDSEVERYVTIVEKQK